MENLCNNCIHKDVCGRYAATWGMKSCEHFMEMPKKGKWVDRYGGKYANPVYDCSVCGKTAPHRNTIDVLGNWRTEQFFANYCPNCGADMRGKEDG